MCKAFFIIIRIYATVSAQFLRHFIMDTMGDYYCGHRYLNLFLIAELMKSTSVTQQRIMISSAVTWR